jgi:hypothetical protein
MMITRGNWEVIEQEQIGNWTVKVYLVLKDGPRPQVAHIKDGFLEMTEIKEGEMEVKPTFDINMDAWRTLKGAMTDKKVREKNEVEAELGATKYHLEDLRKLLKLKDV